MQRFFYMLTMLMLGWAAGPLAHAEEGEGAGEARVPRILLIGDSASFFPFNRQDPPALRQALAEAGGGLEQWEERSLALTTIAGGNPEGQGGFNDVGLSGIALTALEWSTDPEPKRQVRELLRNTPSIDVVQFTLGMNDFHEFLPGQVTEPVINQLYEQTTFHIEEVIKWVLDIRPDVRVVVMGYDYPNIVEGFITGEDGVIIGENTNDTVRFWDIFGWDPQNFFDALAFQAFYNSLYVGIEQRKIAVAQAYDRVEYINNLGYLQALFGVPYFSVEPTAPEGLPATKEQGFAPFPAGYPELFTPIDLMNDPVHQAPEGYVALMHNAINQVYAAWLGDNDAPLCTGITLANATGNSATWRVVFSEPVLGVDAGDFCVSSDGAPAHVDSVMPEGEGTAEGEGEGAASEAALAGSYLVTVSGAGQMRLDLIDNDTIYDAVWNPLGKAYLDHAPRDGDFFGGEQVALDGSPIDPAALLDCAPPLPEGEPEGEGTTEGEGGIDGIAEGEGNLEGEGTTEGVSEGVLEGEGTTEGEGEGAAEGGVEGRPEGTPDGEGATEGEAEPPCPFQPVHNADPNADNVIDLTELLRIIQFFNSGPFGCAVFTEDGFLPGGVDRDCCPHASDYAPQDWQISLSELLRAIQFFNSGGYRGCADTFDTEDGYCPGVQ